jgi:hypothetical protein
MAATAMPPEPIDTSAIEELVGLKRDRAVLAARLERMAVEADKVSQAVFRRVQADYQARLAALDASAAPLKDQARQEYVKLRRQLDEVGAQRAGALQDQEELELRHRLGEFEASEFSARSAEVAQRVTGLDRELAAVTAVRERFVAAFDSEDELTQGPPQADAAHVTDGAGGADSADVPDVAGGGAVEDRANVASLPGSAALTSAGAAEAPAAPDSRTAAKGGARPRPGTVAAPMTQSTQTAQTAQTAQSAPSAPTPPAAPAGTLEVPLAPDAPAAPLPFATLSAAEPMTGAPEAATAPAPPSPAAPPGAGTRPAPLLAGTVVLSDLMRPAEANLAPGGTMIVAFGRLVPLDEAAGLSELRVQPFTTIGRTRQNLIQLDVPSVSRKHAQIVLSEGGYVLRDLGSENGSFVNGERVTEHLLAEGDHLQFGILRFSFHAA